MKKAVIIVLGILIVLLLFVFGARFLTGEDTWICQNGQWIKHGMPSAAQPTTGCEPNQNSKNIIVNLPYMNDVVGSKFTVTGYARVFENQFNIRVLTFNNLKVYESTVTANAKDAGQFGDFQKVVALPNLADGTNLILEVYDLSAKDGSEQDLVKVPLVYKAEAVGITVTAPLPDVSVSSPVTISGTVTGNGWSGFEGQVGSVILLDEMGNSLGISPLTAKTDWTQLPTQFETTLNFNSSKDQNGTLVFTNENPSGDPLRNAQFRLPVVIKKSATQNMTVKVFFNNDKFDPNLLDCSKVYAVNRIIPKTQAVARAALEELLKGPTATEKTRGYITNIINSEVQIQSLTIANGTAQVDFNEALEQGVGGSCRVTAIRSEITNTLKQFPTVQNVVISIDGRTEDILQP
ncbi:MAG: Gmad2 immunoglobulin-like domain-containing protein [Patescibacteria group bacterium]